MSTKRLFTYYIMNNREGGVCKDCATVHVILTSNITIVKLITRGREGV